MDRDATAPTRPSSGEAGVLEVEDYLLLDLLGSGGMGEVLLAEDPRLGRRVALKRMRDAEPSDAAVSRFLREARIQARLEHPAIVPVHEIGRDRNGRPFFTMKRLAGDTLAAKLRDAPDRQAQLHILRAFVDVCRAIELAHANGVIHRDLKPSNIMLGNYGEVYVLDWGVAHVANEAEEIGGETRRGSETLAGAVLGTPGYSAPEQMRGTAVTTASDIYALGAILFEILAGEPLDPKGTCSADASPVRRAPTRAIPPELDAICIRALAAPTERPTARELGDFVQHYLDGDRDLALRRAIADRHVSAAREHLASGDAARRGEATREAGRALALVPDSPEVSDLAGHLLLSPPTTLAPALEQRLANRLLDDAERQGRLASLALGVYLLMLPLALWMKVTSWPTVIAFTILAAALSLLARHHAKRRQLRVMWSVIGNAGIVAVCSRFFGPFVVVPALTAAITIIFMTYPSFGRRSAAPIFILLAGFLLPIVLEGIGWLERTWWLEGGALISRPTALEFDGAAGTVFLLVTNVSLVVVISLLARSFGEVQARTRRQLEIWAWHLEQLLPTSPPASSAASPG